MYVAIGQQAYGHSKIQVSSLEAEVYQLEGKITTITIKISVRLAVR